MPRQIGLLLYPDLTQLDLTAPYQVFAALPDSQIHLIAKTAGPVTSMAGLQLQPTTTFTHCPQLDLICVPGGNLGTAQQMTDPETLNFLRHQAQTAQYITAVCTGSLILAAAGLLDGYKAATHWLFRDQLANLGVEVSTDRVVKDRNRITGGGVTAGIDFALTVAAELAGEQTAQQIQLMLEYNPAPPFNAGSPESAGEALTQGLQQFAKPLLDATQAAVDAVNAKAAG